MTKNIFNPGNYPKNIDIALLVLRVGIGAFMLSHGAGKLLKLFGDGPIKFADPIGVGMTASLALVVFSEVFCSLFLMLGAATRLAAIPLMITMLVAVLVVHSSDPFGEKEPALMYLLVYAVIAIAGAGKASVDNFIYKRIYKQ